MNRAEKARRELLAMDELAAKDSPMHRFPPLCKLLLTLLYIVVVVSFPQYALGHLFVMILFPVIGYQFSLIPVRTCFYKLRVVLPLVCLVGLFNPVFDRQILITVGTVGVSGGVVSMLTLILKGVFCLMASFLLVATTPIGTLCGALRQLHVPKLIPTLLLLCFRYISLLLEEVSIMTTAYRLRAPGQKGIHFTAWGSFLGQLLLRSMDRASALYDSMRLRGYDGEFPFADTKPVSFRSVGICILCACLILLIRLYNLPTMLISSML